jgi:hypothetical protein
MPDNRSGMKGLQKKALAYATHFLIVEDDTQEAITAAVADFNAS